MNIKKILLFLFFAFGISWTSAGILYLSGVGYGSSVSILVIAVCYMMAPAAAALIVQKGIYKESMKVLGLDLKQTRWKQFAWLPLINILFCLLTLLIIYLLGNVLQAEGFGEFSLEQERLKNKLANLVAGSGAPPVPDLPFSPAVLLAIVLVAATLLGGIVNTVFTFGEELGWRGFLYNEMQSLGVLKSNLLIGVIWGGWHAPLILQGHNYPDHPAEGVFMMMLFCIGLAFLMSWTRHRTNSVLAPSILHGMVNATAGGIMLFVYNNNDLLGSIAGAAGAMSALLLGLGLWVVEKRGNRLNS